MSTSVTIVFHITRPDLQDQDQDQDRFFLVSDRSCPNTDGLRPHHWFLCFFFQFQRKVARTCLFWPLSWVAACDKRMSVCFCFVYRWSFTGVTI